MTFDTLDYVRRLRRADVPEQQTEAMADALQAAFSAPHGAATKLDIAELRHDLQTLENRLPLKLTGIALAVAGLVLAIMKLA